MKLKKNMLMRTMAILLIILSIIFLLPLVTIAFECLLMAFGFSINEISNSQMACSWLCAAIGGGCGFIAIMLYIEVS